MTDQQTMESITSFLTDDHRVADRLFAAVRRHGERREWTECGNVLSAFHAALETHMKLEEEVLFPAFEQAAGTDRGPTSVMRIEHREMLDQLDALANAMTTGNGDFFDALARSFLRALDTHSMKEENILYPMCDRLVGTPHAGELKRRLEEIRGDV